MPKSTHRPFEFEGIRLLSSALHAQLMERRRSTLEHDLKNALHGLVSGTELLSKALTATSPRITPAECLSLLQQQITRAQHDLNRMLDEIAPAVLETIEFDLQELLVECRHDLRHDLQNVELTTDLGPRLRIRGCRPRLKDALLYLLFGAMDTMRPATAIELTTRAYGDTATIELRYRPADGQCPPPAKLGEILQLDGLAIACEYVGDSVHVRLSAPLASSRSNSAERLLIVDASRDAADSLVMLAQLAGFDARAAYDLDSALHLARTQPPTAILIDADGSIDFGTLASHVRELAASPRIIAMSHGGLACAPSADARLRKPLDLRELRSVLGT
jgi:hypothetical protein